MLDKNERRHPNYPQISARQAAGFETIRQMNYDAHEITRTENYLLPLLIENSFILAHKTNFEKAVEILPENPEFKKSLDFVKTLIK